MDFKAAVEKATDILSKNPGGTSSYGVFGEKKQKAVLKDICHRSIYSLANYVEDKSYYYTAMDTQPTAAKSPQLSLFGNWLLSDTGPWKNLMIGKGRTVLEKDGVVHGCLFEIDKNTDANLLASLSIAGRNPREYSGSFAFFNHLVLEGVPMADAYFLSAYFTMSEGGAVSKGSFIGTGHSIFDRGGDWYSTGTVNVPTNFKRFSEGDPRKDNIRPISKGGYSQINRIFKNTKDNKLSHIDAMVEVQSTIKGRWSHAFTGISVKGIMDLWEGSYKDELLKVAA